MKAQKENVSHLNVKAINLESTFHLCIHILWYLEGIEFSICASLLHCKLLVWMNNHLLKETIVLGRQMELDSFHLKAKCLLK